MNPLIVKPPPFSGPPPHANEKPTWVKPVLVTEVKFAEWTRDGVMRQPVFLGLRDDIDPRDVRRELPSDTGRETALAKATTRATAKPPTRAATSRARVARKTSTLAARPAAAAPRNAAASVVPGPPLCQSAA